MYGKKNRYYFTDYPATYYKQGDKTIMKAMSRMESNHFYGENLTDQRVQNEYFEAGGKPVGRTTELLRTMASLAQNLSLPEKERQQYVGAIYLASELQRMATALPGTAARDDRKIKVIKNHLEPWLEKMANATDVAQQQQSMPTIKGEVTGTPTTSRYLYGR